MCRDILAVVKLWQLIAASFYEKLWLTQCKIDEYLVLGLHHTQESAAVLALSSDGKQPDTSPALRFLRPEVSLFLKHLFADGCSGINPLQSIPSLQKTSITRREGFLCILS